MPANIGIVTGCSSGLGFCLTEILLNLGWTIIGVSRREVDHGKTSGSFHHVMGSVAEQATADAAFARALELGGANLLVNCAGAGVFGEIGSYSAKDICSVVEANLVGLMLFADRAVVHMGTRGGDIANIISTTAKKYRPRETVYTAAKWGAKAYTRALREEIERQGLKVRVFEIYPCGMNTAFWKTAIRPVTDGANLPLPDAIARDIVAALQDQSEVYQHEISFHRKTF